nr:contact-dependent growth inhibition system immunity protein [Massilia mucilaginosa]
MGQINGTTHPPDASGGLARRVAAAQAKPLKLLQTDELCTLLRQREGGVLALALALYIVGQEPLIQADASPGDLFSLTLEYDWADWHAAQRFGIDPWVCLLEAQSAIAGLRASIAGMDSLCARLDAAATAQPATYLLPDQRLAR